MARKGETDHVSALYPSKKDLKRLRGRRGQGVGG